MGYKKGLKHWSQTLKHWTQTYHFIINPFFYVILSTSSDFPQINWINKFYQYYGIFFFLVTKISIKACVFSYFCKIIGYLKSQICNSLETNLGYIFAHQGGGVKYSIYYICILAIAVFDIGNL